MRRTAGIGISLVVVLSLAATAYAAFMICNNQTAGGTGTGVHGTGSYVLADIDDLAANSDLVVMGEIDSIANITKMAPDTSQPVENRGEDYAVKLRQITFTVNEYLKGSGGDTVTITMSPEDEHDPRGPGATMDDGAMYVMFLFDPNLLTDEDYWAGTYLTLGPQAIWKVSGHDAERLSPPFVLTLESLRAEISNGANR